MSTTAKPLYRLYEKDFRIPDFIKKAELTCEVAKDQAKLDAVRAALQECTNKEQQAHLAIQMANASLSNVTGTLHPREIVVKASLHFVECSNALDIILAQKNRIHAQIALIDRCLASDEYRQFQDALKRRDEIDAMWATISEDVRAQCGHKVATNSNEPFPVKVGTLMACSSYRLMERPPCDEHYSVYVLTGTEDEYCIVYVNRESGEDEKFSFSYAQAGYLNQILPEN